MENIINNQGNSDKLEMCLKWCNKNNVLLLGLNDKGCVIINPENISTDILVDYRYITENKTIKYVLAMSAS